MTDSTRQRMQTADVSRGTRRRWSGWVETTGTEPSTPAPSATAGITVRDPHQVVDAINSARGAR